LFSDAGSDSTTEASVYSKWKTIVALDLQLPVTDRSAKDIVPLSPIFVDFFSWIDWQSGVVISTSMIYLLLESLEFSNFSLMLRGFLFSSEM
jgi:hypothetical protein